MNNIILIFYIINLLWILANTEISTKTTKKIEYLKI